MADQLNLVDGTQRVLEDHATGRLYALTARVDGACSRPLIADVGPALNALYAQALAAVVADPGLGGRASDVREGLTEGIALEVAITHDPYTGATGTFGLNLEVPYWQAPTGPTHREAILAALETALLGVTAGPGLCVRERVLAAFQTHLAAALGLPVERNADRPAASVGGLPVVVLRDGEQGADYETQRRALYDARASVEVFVPGRDPTTLDGLLQAVIGAIQSAGTLGGLVIDVLEGDTDPEVLRQEYTGPLEAGRVDFDLWYSTPAGQPYTVAPA